MNFYWTIKMLLAFSLDEDSKLPNRRNQFNRSTCIFMTHFFMDNSQCIKLYFKKIDTENVVTHQDVMEL